MPQMMLLICWVIVAACFLHHEPAAFFPAEFADAFVVPSPSMTSRISGKGSLPSVWHTSHIRLFESNTGGPTSEKDQEEPLITSFERAVVLQRAGQHDEAMKEYEFFLQAAGQCQDVVEPRMYAEVYGNMGALHLKRREYAEAKASLETALRYRPKFGTAYINLAVVELQVASRVQTTSQEQAKVAMDQIQQAKEYCQDALDCNSDPKSVTTAKKLLHDIETMLSSSSFQ